MERRIDTRGIEPLLRLMQDERPEIAVSAVRTAVRFPLSDDAWRAVAQETARLLGSGIENDALREALISTAAGIPALSVRRRLRWIAESADAPDSEWAYRALADVGDPNVLRQMLQILETGPASDWSWTIERLARMPLETTGLHMNDVPDVPADDPDTRFWHSVAVARLGHFAPLDDVLAGNVEPPTLLYGNPWHAYQRIALVRPLPEHLDDRILVRFGIAPSPDPAAVREAGLLVWALTGVADAQGEIVGPEAQQAETTGEDSQEPQYADAEIDAARDAARQILEGFDANDAIDLPDSLRALPEEDIGPFLRSLLTTAHRRAARMDAYWTFMISNAVVNIVNTLPKTPAVPITALYTDFVAAPQPGVDAEQLAWILARAGAPRVIRALTEGPTDLATLEFLALVGDVEAGVAGSPWRGSGPGGGSGAERRSELIEDEGWAESAPPPEPARGEGAPAPGSVGAGTGEIRRGNGGGGPPAGSKPPEGGPPRTLRAVLSAEGPQEIDVTKPAAIHVRIELEAGAQPLEHAATVDILPEPIAVIVFLSNEAIQLTTAVLQIAPLPSAGTPSLLEFPIVAREVGETRAIINFQQGTTTLAMLSFTMRVVADGAVADTAIVEGPAAARDPFDDGVIRILIQQPTTDTPYYTYFVTSKLLGLVNAQYTSPPFKGDARAEDRPKAYAQSVYKRIETEVLERTADAQILEQRLERIGRDMCKQLLPESLIRELWRHRDRIQSIEITPVEPYIPWELLRLEHPEEGIDTRHLGEYRLVRTLGGKEPARKLGRAEWRYVIGEYPNMLYADLPGERAFLTTDLPTLGVQPKPIASDVQAILAAVDPAEFDVVHFACHGEASLDAIDASALIVADRLTAGQGKVAVKLYPTDLQVKLAPRRPLVFLSACQSSRMAPSLTDFGGWPKVLVDAQAGAMVGTSWAVYEKPAVAFAKAFYQSLLRGETLGEAAGAGRAAARVKGDASWLAYTVYGWSSARMSA